MIHIPWGNGDFTEAPSNQVEKDELKLIRQREGHSRCCGERRYAYNICYRLKARKQGFIPMGYRPQI